MAEQKEPTSRIPRLSVLPVRTSVAGVQRSEQLAGGRSAAQDALRPLKVSRLRPATKTSNPYKQTEQQTDGFAKPLLKQTSVRKDAEPANPSSVDDAIDGHKEEVDEGTGPKTRKARPSLSDRAIETLSQIPPSPSPRRRQSGFFPPDSPAIRPPSSLGRNRPVTSTGFYAPLPLKRPGISRPIQIQSSTLSRPAASTSTIGRTLQRPASRQSRKDPETPLWNYRSSSRTANAESSTSKSPVGAVPTAEVHEDRDPDLAQHACNTVSSKPNLRSSAALRETIANARAARRAAPKYEADEFVTPVNRSNELPGPGGKDVVHVNLLRKRINTARSDGKLNISGMGLKVFPEEVLTMYELDNLNDGPAWYECVDLSTLDASINELEELGWDVSDTPVEDEDQPRGSIFKGLQTLNLLGNRLHSLPSGLRNLDHLSVLNLSRNRLKQPIDDLFDTISNISSLRKLYVAENGLSGPLPPFAHSWNLEILDLNANALISIPEELSNCTRLRQLYLSENKIPKLPSLNLPSLTTLNISSNQIDVESLMTKLTAPELVDLDISMCRIDNLPALRLRFPRLATLTAFGNRISTIDVQSVRGVEVLDLKNNDLRSLPPELGLIGLKKLLVSGNPMRAPRREILEGTTERLLEWLRGRLPADVLDEETF
ncbi:MAG: hypothetical protein LQ338_006115 [Usnochroma carphineum]|nr:MAG: hypothetical protein LQ338_006115 [Usnochroma carphineum]